LDKSSSSFHAPANGEPSEEPTQIDDRKSQSIKSATFTNYRETKSRNCKEHYNLKDLIFDIIQDYEEQLIIKGKSEVRLRYEPKDIFLVADKIRLERVISNLLNNAIKFTANGN
jgi:signal transduction histidine kinase